MDNANYITRTECAEYRKDMNDKIDKNESDIVELKVINAEIKSTMASMVTISKAIFAALSSGIVSIIIILLTRGL